jgi:hypothetical protein
MSLGAVRAGCSKIRLSRAFLVPSSSILALRFRRIGAKKAPKSKTLSLLTAYKL